MSAVDNCGVRILWIPHSLGMVLHVLKGDPMLWDMGHVQVDGPGTAYLFFYDKQGHRGLQQDVTENLRTHVAETFSEWISQSAHFIVILLLLAEGTAYLFFYDKEGHRGLKQDVTENLRTHVAETFSEWISQSAHFIVILLLLVEGTAYLLFYDKEGHRGLKQDVAENLRTHVVEAFSEQISQLLIS